MSTKQSSKEFVESLTALKSTSEKELKSFVANANCQWKR